VRIEPRRPNIEIPKITDRALVASFAKIEVVPNELAPNGATPLHVMIPAPIRMTKLCRYPDARQPRVIQSP
jgi:hypothetical protein